MSFTAAVYCKARTRIKLKVLGILLERCVEQLHQETFDTARWLGHRVFHVDGSSFSMPDTPQLQAHFGQPSGQRPGCGFPTAHWLVLLHAGTGMIAKMLASPLRTHDLSKTARLHPELRGGRPVGCGSGVLFLCPFGTAIPAWSAWAAAHPPADDRRFHAGPRACSSRSRQSGPQAGNTSIMLAQATWRDRSDRRLAEADEQANLDEYRAVCSIARFDRGS